MTPQTIRIVLIVLALVQLGLTMMVWSKMQTLRHRFEDALGSHLVWHEERGERDERDGGRT